MKQLLEIENLSVQFTTNKGSFTAIQDITLNIGAGETVCLVGESGSGKSVTSKSVMRLIDYENGVISGGQIVLDGDDLATLSQKELRALRGKKMAMVFQEPMAAFDPVFTIGSQITEVIIQHKQGNREQAWERAVHLLKRVGIPEPEIRMNQYPGELSGGMLQRAMIAMALSCNPQLLIADEPTTALDVTIQAQILHLLQELKDEFNMSILLITHDMGIAAEMADRIIVMYAGQIVEQATVQQLFTKPHHPYTRGLLRSITTMDSDRTSRLFSIEGTIPHLSDLPTGCRFHPRCPFATDRCKNDSPPLQSVNGRLAACWYSEDLVKLEDWQQHTTPADTAIKSGKNDLTIPELGEQETATEKLFEVKGLSKFYPVGKGTFNRSKTYIRAVDDVSFSIKKGETFGLVGESGSGKSTLGRVLLQLERATEGKVLFEGKDLSELSAKGLQGARRDMQVIFQDPYGSVNPRWKVGDIIGEPFDVHESLSKAEKRAKVEELLELVGLNRSMYDRFPHEFSGGQRQRIGIARAIALHPQFILADEAVSALDVSVQAQIVNLMQDLQRKLGLTYLFIAHGLNIVRHLSDRIGVMYLGKLVEIAPSEELFLHPSHHYTKGLLSSIPSPDPTRKREWFAIEGEIPSPANPPSGCRFHTRCPAATARCREEQPELLQLRKGHWTACHYPL
ncbi:MULTISPECIES: ABC transporter ATP-binding protein [unclassified Paenibacillus]|uniref:ABC transporter ATP-binding protein n=1 Tax=unclassified Paenibacillus TaxID=185978 RepID=UPI00070CCC2F|nr:MULTISPECIES: ABC transporter ATP-binding protein [unclassified Paenibacillus]KQX48215.1 glutathione ABC transporter ATP-binding protein [Paenibacillus sp. Root444D2]KRE52180.1 glutathione ABC transporter ATP-binding protein [Paenibacillus sp. Soil724D2]